MQHITRFAVKRELFDRAHTTILEGMPGLRELCVVWGDWRSVAEARMETGVGFREVDEGELMGRGRGGDHSKLILLCFFVHLSVYVDNTYSLSFWDFEI